MERSKKGLKIAVALTLIISMIIPLVSCGSFKAGVPSGFIGEWQCESTASDGKTDTSFYKMYIKKDGSFSIYDAAAGNPGISGYMGNKTASTVDCKFNMEDFDVPFCWDIDSDTATLYYELKDDTLKLGHNGVWMIFHPDEEDGENSLIPQSLDEVISVDIPEQFTLEMEYPYAGEEENPVVQKAFSSEKDGYFTLGFFSYKGWDCLGDTNSTIDLEDSLKYLDGMREIGIAGETGYFGTRESDDIPNMVAVVYVEHGEYIFEFRLTNGDEQITDEQIKGFETIIGTVQYKF